MQPYISKSGKESGVIAYKIGSDYISVKFKTSERYLYSYKSCGKKVVEKMKKLAQHSEGLSTYISQNQPQFEKKINND